MTRALVWGALVAAAVALIAAWALRRRDRRDPANSLYERLGGVFAISAVVDRFSDEVLRSPLVGVNSPNPALREWSRKQSGTGVPPGTPNRLPGLKWLRTLWVCDVTGGPYKFVGTKPGATPLGLEEAHRHLKITAAEFDEVARILAQTLGQFGVPEPDQKLVLGAFAAHKAEVTLGSH